MKLSFFAYFVCSSEEVVCFYGSLVFLSFWFSFQLYLVFSLFFAFEFFVVFCCLIIIVFPLFRLLAILWRLKIIILVDSGNLFKSIIGKMEWFTGNKQQLSNYFFLFRKKKQIVFWLKFLKKYFIIVVAKNCILKFLVTKKKNWLKKLISKLNYYYYSQFET